MVTLSARTFLIGPESFVHFCYLALMLLHSFLMLELFQGFGCELATSLAPCLGEPRTPPPPSPNSLLFLLEMDRATEQSRVGANTGVKSFVGRRRSASPRTSASIERGYACKSINSYPTLTYHGTFRFYDDSTKSIVHLMVFDRMNEENVIIFRSYLRILSASDVSLACSASPC